MAREDTKAIYERAGLAHRLGFGKRPALVAVDMQIGFTAPEKSPLAGNLDSQVAAINKLIAVARPKGVPIIFTAVGYEPLHQAEAGMWVEKVPTLRHLKIGSDLVELDPRLDHKPGDIVIIKQYPSAFFGTHLTPTLTARGIDTVIVTGCTTSGCVRATAVDAISSGFRPIVPIEGVGDRAQEPHEANLFDISSKYGDVMPIEEVLDYLEGLE